MDDAVWSLLFRLEGENASLRAAIDDSERRIAGLEGTVGRSSRNIGAGLSQMSRGAGQVASGLDRLATRGAIAAAGGIAAVTKAAIDFDSAFAGVRKTVDASPASLAAFREEIRGMAREIPIAHGELARIAEAGGALGVGFDPATGQTNLATLREFTKTSALLGETTDVSSDQAATSLGVLSNVLGLVDQDYSRFGSTLVDLGNKGASTESQILGIAERAGAGAKLIDMSAASTLGWSSAIANLGIEVEAGGTSLQTFFVRSLEMISEGGAELDVFASTAGMARDEFQELFGRDSSAALTAFIGGLGELEEAERLAVLEALGFNDIRITRALLGLSGDVDNLTDSLRIADQAWEKNSALGEEAAKRFETTQSQLALLRNNAIDAAITIGDELLPIVNEFAKEGVAWLIAHRGEIKEFGENLAVGIRGLGEGLKSTDWGALLSTLSGAAAIAKGAFDAFMKLPDPVKQLVLAAIIGNKVTGGALFDIARGLTNIFGGALKTIHAGHVTVIGPGGTGAGGIGGAAGRAGGGGGMLANALKFLPVIAAAAIADEFEDEIQGLAAGIHDSFLKGLPTSGISMNDLEWPFGPKNTPTILPEIFGDNGLLGGTAAPGKQMSGPMPKAGDLAADAAAADQALLAQWGGQLDKLATNEVIEHLARTNEIGMAGLGNSFQVGLTNGLDPIGDVATRILARAEDPLAPAVMFEIQGHISSLEEIQAQYLAQGDLPLAAKVQTNIDTLHALIGTTDQVRAVTAYLHADAVAADAAMLGSLAFQTSAINAMHGTLAAKSFSTSVYVSWGGDWASFSGHEARVGGFADGTWEVPGTGLAMLHEGEMVIPRFDAEAFREMLAGGGGGGGGPSMEFHEGAIQINNPTPEPASRSQARALRDIALRYS